MANSLHDALLSAGIPEPKEGSNIVSIHLEPQTTEDEGITGLVVRMLGPKDRVRQRFSSSNALFLEVRRLTRDLLNDQSWNLRYASQMKTDLLPFLHSVSSLSIFVDVMAPYRDPVRELSVTGELRLIRLESRPYYFRPRDAVPGFDREPQVKKQTPST